MPAMGQVKLDSLAIQADSVFLHDRSEVVGKVCAGRIGADPSVVKPAVCEAERTVPALATVSATARNVEVGWGLRSVLDTGEHGDVLVRSGAKLRLRSGSHRFRSLTLERDARLELDSVLAGDTGAVRVQVAGAVRLMDRTATALGSVVNDTALAQVAARLVVWAGSVQIDNDADLGGQWNAVNKMVVGDRSLVVGGLSGATVVAGYDARVRYEAGVPAGPAVPVVRILSPATGLVINAASLPVAGAWMAWCAAMPRC